MDPLELWVQAGLLSWSHGLGMDDVVRDLAGALEALPGASAVCPRTLNALFGPQKATVMETSQTKKMDRCCVK